MFFFYFLEYNFPPFLMVIFKHLVTFFTILFLSLVLLPVCQMITNTGVFCVFKHLSNDNNDSRDRNKYPFQKKKKDTRGTSFQKWNYNSAVSSCGPDMLAVFLIVYSALSLPKHRIHIVSPKSCSSPLQALSAAGLGAGLTEAVVVNPFEVVKVSLQANRDSFKEVDRNKTPS